MTHRPAAEPQPARLHLFCGLIGSGKSTLAKEIARRQKAARLVEDDWLHALWPGEVVSVATYLERARRLQSILWPHVSALLAQGVAVVLDFPANTRAQRAAFSDLLQEAPRDHILHHLDTPAAVCKARLAARNASGAHPFAPTPAEFDLFARHFEPPAEDEGLIIQSWPDAPPARGGAG